MDVRPFALLGAGALAAVRAELQAAVGLWCAAWGVAPADVLLDCARACEAPADAPAGAPRRSYAVAGRQMWLTWHPEWTAQIQRAVFPPDRGAFVAPVGPGVAGAGAEAAQAAWCEALAALLGAGAAQGAEAAPAGAFLRGSGAVRVTLRLGKQACWCVLGETAVAALRKRRDAGAAALAPLPRLDYRHLLRDVAVSLPVAAGAAEVGLASLMTLRVGDVIRLDTLAERPVALAGPGGGTMLEGYLGVVDKMVAMEIVRRNK